MSRHQYTVLDGLRGVAAIGVMLFHRRDWFGGEMFMQHAPLAVDFFFLLSGFVLAHAYSKRLAVSGAFLPFVRDRILRLHPMLIVGAITALIVTLIEHKTGHNVPFTAAPLTFLASIVPAPAPWAGGASAFPWNIALWSLFWELIANLLFAAVAARLTDRTLLAIIGSSASAMVLISFIYGGFGVGFQNDTVLLFCGFPRVCAAFFLGVGLYRWRDRLSVPPNSWGGMCAIILVLTFIPPRLPRLGSSLYDLGVAYLLYPAVLLIASRSTPRWPRTCTILGAISYPLYVIHEPALKLISGTLNALHLTNGTPTAWAAIMRLILVVIGSYVVLKIYDEPVRRWIRSRLIA